jgi:predicted porin
MKKSLIALAAIAAVGAASAQVTVYGKADVGYVDAGSGGKVDSGVYETSRIGLKGETDIGNGMKASFQLEKAISVTDGQSSNWLGAGSLFDRVGMVAVSGSFGTVSAGLQWSPYDNAFWTADANEYNGFSASNKVFCSYKFSAHCDNGNTGWGNVQNSVQYATPDINGWQGFIMTAPNVVHSGGITGYTGYGINYSKGPLNISYAGENYGSVSSMIIGGNYNLGAVTVYAGYETADTGSSVINGAKGGKDTGYSFGVKVPMGKNYVTAGWATEKTTPVSGAEATITGWGAQFIAPLGKQLVGYAGYRTVQGTTTVNTTGAGFRYNF